MFKHHLQFKTFLMEYELGKPYFLSRIVRYVEIIDEEVYDLLASPQKRNTEEIRVIESTWEGPTV